MPRASVYPPSHMRLLLFLAAALIVAPAAAAQDALASGETAPSSTAPALSETVLVVAVPADMAPEARAAAEAAGLGARDIDTDKQFGIGPGSAFLSFGISGTYDVNETITAEAIVGFLSSLTSIGGRVWYRFNRNEGYDLYGFGGVSFLRFGGLFDESAVGVSGGAGVEIGLPQVLDNPDFPPIFLNLDIGIGVTTFDVYDGFSALGGGGGIHFRF